MKKLLVGTAAIALGLAMAAPAKAADGVKLSLGGHFKGYVSWVDQDEDQTVDGLGTDATDPEQVRNFDILRDTEIHFGGETTLDNGLTVGFHSEAHTDGATGAGDSFNVDESYAYFSGMWGRVNFGKEDGAAYLLQVAAPSADSNVDGLRAYVQPVNYTLTLNNANYLAMFGNTFATAGEGLDYDQDIARGDNKISYLTPVWNGFQAGVSYTPETGAGIRDLNGNNVEDGVNNFGDSWDVALRYEGKLDQVGVTAGAGWTHVDLEKDSNAAGTVFERDDRQAWNAGLNLAWGAFNLGGAYAVDDNGHDLDADTETWVVGLDYTTGPFKLGVSYLDQNQELDGIVNAGNIPTAYVYGNGEIQTSRWTGGVVYTYGPGMTFRGSISYVDHEFPRAVVGGIGAEQDTNATSVLLGTQINF